jgi:hypothetical protein
MPLLGQCHVCLNLLLVDSQHLEQFLLFSLQYFIGIYQILAISGNAQTQHTDKQQYQQQEATETKQQTNAEQEITREFCRDQLSSFCRRHI